MFNAWAHFFRPGAYIQMAAGKKDVPVAIFFHKQSPAEKTNGAFHPLKKQSPVKQRFPHNINNF
jgi:hypothetical protein